MDRWLTRGRRELSWPATPQHSLVVQCQYRTSRTLKRSPFKVCQAVRYSMSSLTSLLAGLYGKLTSCLAALKLRERQTSAPTCDFQRPGDSFSRHRFPWERKQQEKPFDSSPGLLIV